MKKLYLVVVGAMVMVSATGWAKPLDLMLGARPHAMGGAFAAIANDVNAVYWNPAGMAMLETMEFGASNRVLQEMLNVNVNMLNGVVPIKGIGACGGSWQMTYAGLEEGDPDAATGYRENSWRENSFTLAFARQLWEKLGIFRHTCVGVNLNRLTYAADAYQGSGLGFDVGLLTLFPYDIRLGVMARALASDMGGEMFTPEYRVGLGYIRTFKQIHTLTVASDALFKSDVEYVDATAMDPAGMNIKLFEGVEYAVKFSDFKTAVRAGCNLTLLHDRVQMPLSATGGLGLGYKNYSIDYALDYNTDPDFSLGMQHHIAFTFKK